MPFQSNNPGPDHDARTDEGFDAAQPYGVLPQEGRRPSIPGVTPLPKANRASPPGSPEPHLGVAIARAVTRAGANARRSDGLGAAVRQAAGSLMGRLKGWVKRVNNDPTHADPVSVTTRSVPVTQVPYTGQEPPTPRAYRVGKPRRMAAYKSPAGGMVVRGVYYQGGQTVPDLAGAFAQGPKTRRQRLRAALKKRKTVGQAVGGAMRLAREDEPLLPEEGRLAAPGVDDRQSRHNAMIEALHANPGDVASRSAQIDYLEWQGHPGLAEYARMVHLGRIGTPVTDRNTYNLNFDGPLLVTHHGKGGGIVIGHIHPVRLADDGRPAFSVDVMGHAHDWSRPADQVSHRASLTGTHLVTDPAQLDALLDDADRVRHSPWNQEGPYGGERDVMPDEAKVMARDYLAGGHG